MMLIRSSSTPLLGSLLSSLQESPAPKHPSSSSSVHQNCGKLACSNNGVSQIITRSTSLQSPSVAEIKGSSAENGFRRVQSEGNLDALAMDSYCNLDEFSLSNAYSKKFARKPKCSTLEAIPSFTRHHVGTTSEDRYSDDEEEEEEEEELEVEEVNAYMDANFAFEDAIMKMNAYTGTGFQSEGKMYLAMGLGFPGIAFVDSGGSNGSGGGGGGGALRPVDFSRDGGESHGVGIEEHYKSMLEENPGNPLFLRNYAEFLYLKRGDLEGAEQYYSRAILADPRDGEILCQYAKLIWELHHDKDRAALYFKRALQASSEDSHVHAAYANFLWDIEDEEEESAVANSHLVTPVYHHGIVASATV
ncbi:hypothetical protein ABFS83_14G207400 [Erythranthe nasuta]